MTDAALLDQQGLKNNSGRLIHQHVPSFPSGGNRGQRECLGFIGGLSGNGPYVHVKTTGGGSSDRMHKFEYNGYTYNHLNVHNSLTFYTYSGQATPYVPSLVNWGEYGANAATSTGGIINYYYSSSDDKVVIVLQVNGSYTGGFLYHQSGSTHVDHAMDVLAVTQHASATSGVY